MKMTIAEMRKRALNKFNDAYINDINVAKNLINRYYRICALESYLLEAENDEKRYNLSYVKNERKKADRYTKRLANDLNRYGLFIEYYGYLPSIIDHKGGNSVIDTYFYN